MNLFKQGLLVFSSMLFLILNTYAENVKICLAIVVKNEEDTIWRCLNSAKDLIDCLCICDAGSTDNTIPIVKQFMQDHKIPGNIYQHEWKSAGENRTLCANAAKQVLKELGFSLEHSYTLSLNADDMLKISPGFRKDQLDADAYLLRETSSFLSYSRYNFHLLRSSIHWQSNGTVHEQWSCSIPVSSKNLQNLTIEDQVRGSNEDTLRQNVDLLTSALEKDPENSKYMFYLAQSYKCLKNYEKAIFWYQARLKKEEEMEEVWFSKYMLGECCEELGDWDQALSWYLNAYQSNPDRAEPLKKIASHYRLQGQNELAYIFAKHGSRIPYPNDPISFSSSPCDVYQFDEELSIAAYYTRFRNEGYQAASDLLIKKNVPWYIKDQTAKTFFFTCKTCQMPIFNPSKSICRSFIKE